MLKNAKELTEVNNNDDTLLHLLIASDRKLTGTDLKMLEMLLATPLVNSKNKKGNTPLVEVYFNSKLLKLKCLTRDDFSKSQKTIFEKLVFGGADASITNNEGIAAIHNISDENMLKLLAKALSTKQCYFH